MKKQEQSARTRQALTDAAPELFTERGYDHASAMDIARGAGVTVGALHYHFRGKVGLFRAVFQEVREAHTE